MISGERERRDRFIMGNILIVDDSPVERKIIAQSIKNRFRDINIFEADDGLNVTSDILSNNIQVCILDIMMPEKNGFEILEEIKTDNNFMDIPVIVCTGISEKEAVEKALSLGAYDYFSKPLSEEAIKISMPLKVKNAIDLMRRKEETIFLSYHDKLTGLYNRRYSEEEMKRLDTERNLPFSLIMGDVNGLKLTNDAFGHETGDRLLKKIACILKTECRKDEIVARIDGDEFLILLPRTSASDTEKIIYRIKNRCNMEKGEPIKPSISFGYAIKEKAEENIMKVYKSAEDRMYNNKMTESKNIRSTIIDTLVKILNQHYSKAEDHGKRLKELCDAMGKEMGFTIEQIDNLKLLALLHNIGITALPKDIMNADFELMPEEESKFKNHCEIGYRIANSLPEISKIAPDILSHHERWDGNGYPQGLKGEEIPLNARIISIMDTYDSMVYVQKSALKAEAVEFIKENSGTYFDPELVEVFIKIIN